MTRHVGVIRLPVQPGHQQEVTSDNLSRKIGLLRIPECDLIDLNGCYFYECSHTR